MPTRARYTRLVQLKETGEEMKSDDAQERNRERDRWWKSMEEKRLRCFIRARNRESTVGPSKPGRLCPGGACGSAQ